MGLGGPFEHIVKLKVLSPSTRGLCQVNSSTILCRQISNTHSDCGIVPLKLSLLICWIWVTHYCRRSVKLFSCMWKRLSSVLNVVDHVWSPNKDVFTWIVSVNKFDYEYEKSGIDRKLTESCEVKNYSPYATIALEWVWNCRNGWLSWNYEQV